MNGLTRPSVEAGGLAWFAVGGDEAAAGAEEVAAAGANAGAGAGALAELDGVEDVAAAGAGAGVCASAPETRRGSPTSAPINEIRSIMRQNPKTIGARFMRPRVRFTIPIKVNIFRHASNAAMATALSRITPREPKKQRPPEGGLQEARARLIGFHSMPGESRLLRARR